MKEHILACLIAALLGALPAKAEVVEKAVEYKDNEVTLRGLSYSDGSTQPASGVLIFSDWMGIGPFAKERAKQLVALGYRAFVADIYGGGMHAASEEQARELAGKFKADRPLMRRRGRAALNAFIRESGVAPDRISAIGFCFGGTAALELARDGAQLKGVVSFHGGLDTPDPALARNIKASILALHGADDPYVPPAVIRAFEDEMKKAHIDWQLVEYGNAVHAFTNPEAGTDKSKGAAYNSLAAARAYTAMEHFLQEVFAGGK